MRVQIPAATVLQWPRLISTTSAVPYTRQGQDCRKALIKELIKVMPRYEVGHRLQYHFDFHRALNSWAHRATVARPIGDGPSQPVQAELIHELRQLMYAMWDQKDISADKRRLALETLFNGFMQLKPRGICTLLLIREALFEIAGQRRRGDAEMLKVADNVIQRVLAPHFGQATLEIKPIAWSEMPAFMVDYVAKHEAVHPTYRHSHLRRRFGPGRRCMGLFHPLFNQEPLAFVHIALTDTIPTSLNEIKDVTGRRAKESVANCAIFYSITVPRAGVRGLDLGGQLLQGSVLHLRKNHPSIHKFCTLSPAPTLLKWWQAGAETGPCYTPAEDVPDIYEVAELPLPEDCTAESVRKAAELYILSHLRVSGTHGMSELEWQRDSVPDCFRATMEAATTAYVKSGSCSVTRFHLLHGAALHRVCWLGDPKRSGMRQSGGMMVNYAYEPQEMARRQQLFLEEGVVEDVAEVKSPWTGRDARYLARRKKQLEKELHGMAREHEAAMEQLRQQQLQELAQAKERHAAELLREGR